MEQITYGGLRSSAARKEMLEEEMISLGTQSGNYGEFQEQARILTLGGSEEIIKELHHLAETIGHDMSAVFELLPTLEKLLK